MHKTISCNDSLEGMAEIIPNLVYSRPEGANGIGLKMQLILPWWDRLGQETPAFPAILFVQGSAWTFPNVWMEVPQLAQFARKGYAVATIEHRNSLEGHPFPACLQDVKTALRFLRKEGRQYGIDTERIGIWGTSSGGNLALLTAMTAGQEEFETKEYGGMSENLDYCVACFPPTDLHALLDDQCLRGEFEEIFYELAGKCKDREYDILRQMSPYHLARQSNLDGKKMKLPPVFLAHGTKDQLIPYEQSRNLYEELVKNKADVDFVSVDGADHEGNFWTKEILQEIENFIREKQG